MLSRFIEAFVLIHLRDASTATFQARFDVNAIA
jgi:hypothetical protein